MDTSILGLFAYVDRLLAAAERLKGERDAWKDRAIEEMHDQARITVDANLLRSILAEVVKEVGSIADGVQAVETIIVPGEKLPTREEAECAYEEAGSLHKRLCALLTRARETLGGGE